MKNWYCKKGPAGNQSWRNLATPANGATLYHDERWLRLLEQAYGFEITIAGIRDGTELGAACLLARTKNPFNRRSLALPFSDSCPPLATDPGLLALLAEGLIGQTAPRGGYEIRGIALPAPGRWWTVSENGAWI